MRANRSFLLELVASSRKADSTLGLDDWNLSDTLESEAATQIHAHTHTQHIEETFSTTKAEDGYMCCQIKGASVIWPFLSRFAI